MSNWIPKIVYDGTTIDFEYPPKGKEVYGETDRFIGIVSVSKSGVEQTLTDHVEIGNSIDFSHVSETIVEQLKTFVRTWGYMGKEFEYFFDKDVPASSVTVTLAKTGRQINFKTVAWRNRDTPPTPMYKFKLKLRRVA